MHKQLFNNLMEYSVEGCKFYGTCNNCGFLIGVCTLDNNNNNMMKENFNVMLNELPHTVTD